MARAIVDWESVVLQFEKSGLSQKDFCAQESLMHGTFKYWLYRIRNSREVQTSPSFVKILTPLRATPLQGIGEVTYPNGVSIKLSAACDLQTLSSLIALG